jgi:hypothetical protein
MADIFGIKISKPGDDVFTTPNKNLAFSGQFDTFKILHTGTLSYSLPDETLTSTTKTYTATYTHNLGYIPFFLPQVLQVLNLDEPNNSSTTFQVNDAAQFAIPRGGYDGSLAAELASIYVTSTTLVFEIVREETVGVAANFGPHTATVDYTLFYNRIDETFDLT